MKSRFVALSALVAITVSACSHGGGGGASPLPAGPQSPATAGSTSFAWGKEELNGASYVGPANVAHMQVYVEVQQQNAQALEQYAQQVSDPSSPAYRQYLTPDQIGDRFGASQQDYRNTAAYFVKNGLAIGGWPQRLMLSVAGSQSNMERAFNTKFGVYLKDGEKFVAPRTTPRFAASLPVSRVGNLVTRRRMHRYVMLGVPRANGAADSRGYSPQQLRAAFDYTGAYNAGYTGTGITIGVIGTGLINVTRGANPDPCGDNDLTAMAAAFNTTAAPVCERDVTTSGVALGLSVSGIPTAAPGSPAPNATPSPNPGVPPYGMFPYAGGFTTPPPVSSTNPEDLESQLDTQQTALLAPGSSVKFYLAYNNDCYVYFPQTCNATGSNAASQVLGLSEADAEIQQVIGDNTADVISISYGGGEPQGVNQYFGSGTDPSGYETLEFAAMAAEGMAVFVSSGDNGSAECLGNNSYLSQVCVGDPSGNKNVTSVGGVNLPINEFGQLTSNMTAWGVTNGGNPASSGPGGSGGGTSTIFTAPSWQRTAIGASMREQPDVSLEGDTNTGVDVYTNGSADSSCPSSGPCGPVGGTSVAAPQMAAMWALVLQACKASLTCNTGGTHGYRLGNAAPYFYSIYKGSNLVPASPRPAPAGMPYLPYANVFYDVVYGNNAMPGIGGTSPTPIPGMDAGTGYDQVTGLGVPFARHLIKAVTNE